MQEYLDKKIGPALQSVLSVTAQEAVAERVRQHHLKDWLRFRMAKKFIRAGIVSAWDLAIFNFVTDGHENCEFFHEVTEVVKEESGLDILSCDHGAFFSELRKVRRRLKEQEQKLQLHVL